MRSLRAALVLGLLAAAPAARAQDAPPAGPAAGDDRPVSTPGGPPPDSPDRIPDVGREGMWPAPTEEDWRKPVLIRFQRTWEDAVQVSRETGRAILVCVNMDGEIASEHYAGVRYRQPEIAALYEPYVCVIASVYRHTPRDHDDEGRRILCPRFGSVTCGEHIALEPVVYERYLDGRRIAPRHIMVELDGKETFDVYYANDTASIFRTIQDGIAKRGVSPPPVVRGDRPMTERVGSRDAADREAVEATYASGDAATRAGLLDAALALKGRAPVELLRQAIFGLDAEASRTARKALAQAEGPGATDLIVEALRVPMAEDERTALLAALDRLGETSPRAKWLAALNRGLAGSSSAVDVEGWTKTAAAAAPEETRDAYTLENDRYATEQARRAAPEDPAALMAFATASLQLAENLRRDPGGDPASARLFTKLLYADARSAAARAEELGAKRWDLDAVVAVAAYRRDDFATAYERAEAAVRAMPKGEPGWTAATALTIFAEGRFKAIKAAVREKRRWPPEWLADVNAAYAVLLEHPLGTDAQVVWHQDFLAWLGAWHRSQRVLEAGLRRFPSSQPLHDALRTAILRDRGLAELEAWYEKRLAEDGAPQALQRFAAAASVAAAQYQRTAGNPPRAYESFARALGHLDRAAEADPSFRAEADRRTALVLAGRARLAFEHGELERCLDDVVAAFERAPGAVGDLDALGFTPALTAQSLRAALVEKKRDDLVARLDAATAKVDPVLLVPKE